MAAQGRGWSVRAAAWGDRVAARLAARARPRGALAWPEARAGGSAARGRLILEGRWRIGADLLDGPGVSVWDLAPEAAELHAMAWLDDLLALGTPPARRLAQGWVGEWIARFGTGRGPGWTPELAAGRLRRMLGHGRVLLHRSELDEERLARAVAAQARFLERRWTAAAPGPARIGALTAWLLAALAGAGRPGGAERARAALAAEAPRVVDAEGGLASRNPEELLEVAAWLAEAGEAQVAAGQVVDPDLGAALGRAAGALRALRLGDGGLARFHGGGRGAEGLAEALLAQAGRRVAGGPRGAARAMGFLRLAAGRTVLVADAALLPPGPRAQASTLGFEMSSGRRMILGGIGPGQGFGPDWERAARATAGHSTLDLGGRSSAQLGPPGAPLSGGPRRVIVEGGALGPEGLRVELAHDGWRGSHGLTHARILTLSADGRRLSGEDLLTTLTRADQDAFDRAMGAARGVGLPFALRFHLHPDVEAEPAGGGVLRLRLRSGEDWEFRAGDDLGELRLEPSGWLDAGRRRPRLTTQVVWAARALGPVTRLRWTLEKGAGTPEGLRDLGPDLEEDEE